MLHHWVADVPDQQLDLRLPRSTSNPSKVLQSAKDSDPAYTYHEYKVGGS